MLFQPAKASTHGLGVVGRCLGLLFPGSMGAQNSKCFDTMVKRENPTWTNHNMKETTVIIGAWRQSFWKCRWGRHKLIPTQNRNAYGLEATMGRRLSAGCAVRGQRHVPR